MSAEKTQIDAVAPDELRDDREDTFRSGPPGGISAELDDDADTGEMLAAAGDGELEPPFALEEAGPTEVSPAPRPAAPKLRVVERVRERPKLPIPEEPPPAKPGPRKPLPKAAPKKAVPKAYDPFSVEDPPAVGVDPAVFPIHRSAPQQHAGQRIILALTGVLIALIAGAFVFGSESPDERAVRLAKKGQSTRVAKRQRQAEANRQSLARTAAQVRPSSPAATTIDRASRIRRPKKEPARPRPKALIQPAERAPHVFADGKVSQPKKYGEQAEHLPPPGLNPLLIVMSQPQALVFKDSKLFGATPLMVPVDPKTRSVTLTLRTFGYLEKTIDVQPGASGNLEASVVLAKDPAYENVEVVTTEKPRG